MQSWLCAVHSLTLNAGISVQLAPQMLSTHDTTIRLSPAYDMWQLGMLVYEALAQESYWPQGLLDQQILRALDNPSALLPHEERPVHLEFVHKILLKLMHRDPEHRFSSADLIIQLEHDLATSLPTLNSNWSKQDSGDMGAREVGDG